MKTDQDQGPIQNTVGIVQRVELRYRIHRDRDRPFLIPKPSALAPLASWEDLQEEKEQRQYTRAMVAGMIVIMAVWLWLLAVGVHWVGAQIWHAIGAHAWAHLLGGGLSL
jgi:hypothetical protein